MIFGKRIIACIFIAILSSCVSYKPIFDENNKFVEVGQENADKDFKICKSKAENILDKYKSRKVMNDVKRNSILVGIIGGITGLIFGNSTKSLLGGLAIGAVYGGVAGGLTSYGEDKLQPDEFKQRFITRCLNNQGYEIIGWY